MNRQASGELGSRLYQLSTTAALVQGVLKGALSSDLLLKNGDFGVGTFEGLDGEMAILDGCIYQMCADGHVEERAHIFEVPFAQVCQFISPQVCSFLQVDDLTALEEACDLCRTSENIFYAFWIEAHFKTMHARSVRAAPKGASLATAGSNEAKFTWNDVNGLLIGFWSPAFTSSFSVPGYHFHFISDDRKRGGHVLDCSFQTAASRVQLLTEYDVVLPSSGAFLRADLSVDISSVLRKVE